MNESRWSPEWIIQAGKELTTALFGGYIIWYTLDMAAKIFALAGDPAKMSSAKDLLLLVLGLTGVVIGYYFGRVPADARAAQAQQQANTAVARMKEVDAMAEKMSKEMREPPRDMAADDAWMKNLISLADEIHTKVYTL